MCRKKWQPNTDHLDADKCKPQRKTLHILPCLRTWPFFKLHVMTVTSQI